MKDRGQLQFDLNSISQENQKLKAEVRAKGELADSLHQLVRALREEVEALKWELAVIRENDHGAAADTLQRH